jgi:uncharacterized protein YndB with AHSA1/START domain
MESTPDRIVKQTLLRAPRERVWRALTDSRQFGLWFGAAFDGPFVPGTRVTGRIVPTTMDPEVARHQQPYTGVPCDLLVERMEPEQLFSFRWHPGIPAAGEDPEALPTTLVEFTLEAVAEGTLLTITESGFDRIPLARRAQAFTDNEGGWTIQLRLVARFLAHAA